MLAVPTQPLIAHLPCRENTLIEGASGEGNPAVSADDTADDRSDVEEEAEAFGYGDGELEETNSDVQLEDPAEQLEGAGAEIPDEDNGTDDENDEDRYNLKADDQGGGDVDSDSESEPEGSDVELDDEYCGFARP